MPRKTSKQAKEVTPKVVVNQDSGLALPPAKKPAGQTSIGVTGVRRRTAPASKQVAVSAVTAATASAAFGRPGVTGGAAFHRWCAEQGYDPNTTRSLADWAPLLQAFSERPIYGHRRGSAGGNHRQNRN